MSATKRHIRILLLLAAGLLAGCVREDPPTPETQEEIRLDASIWQMMQGAPARRVSTYENAPLRASTYNGGTLTSGSFTAAAYVENTTTPYINPVQVNWETDKWVWSDGKHYWPASGSLDFFAYMPATIPSYITDNSGTECLVSYVACNPQFSCTMPMTYNSESPTEGQGSGLKEFIYALTTGQDKEHQGASGVTMNFQHPFAKINLQLSASHPDIYIDSIRLKGVMNNGDYGHVGGWTPSGTAKNFVIKLNQDFTDNADSAPYTQLGTSFLMIPQNWAGEIEVWAGWTDWGEILHHRVTATVPTTWQAGYTYTYTFTITETDMVVSTTKFTEQW